MKNPKVPQICRRQKINEIFDILSKTNPVISTELQFENKFTLLIAVMLSAQTTDVSVNKATKELFKLVKTPKALLQIGEVRLKQYIKSIGLYNSKASNIIKLCNILIRDYNAEVPANYEQLIALPGVGSKTAYVVMNCGFGMPTIAVDTHVHRVANRLGIVKTKTPAETERLLSNIVPPGWRSNAHHWLIKHGRYICTARKPKCNECKLLAYCRFGKVIYNFT